LNFNVEHAEFSDTSTLEIAIISSACVGYSTEVLGIQNHCRFRDLHQTVELCCVADVIPSLPLLEVTTSLPKSSRFCSMADSECVVSSALMTVYAGQRYLISVSSSSIYSFSFGTKLTIQLFIVVFIFDLMWQAFWKKQKPIAGHRHITTTSVKQSWGVFL